MTSAMRATLEDQVVARQTLYPSQDVTAGGFFGRAWDTVAGRFG